MHAATARQGAVKPSSRSAPTDGHAVSGPTPRSEHARCRAGPRKSANARRGRAARRGAALPRLPPRRCTRDPAPGRREARAHSGLAEGSYVRPSTRVPTSSSPALRRFARAPTRPSKRLGSLLRVMPQPASFRRARVASNAGGGRADAPPVFPKAEYEALPGMNSLTFPFHAGARRVLRAAGEDGPCRTASALRVSETLAACSPALPHRLREHAPCSGGRHIY